MPNCTWHIQVQMARDNFSITDLKQHENHRQKGTIFWDYFWHPCAEWRSSPLKNKHPSQWPISQSVMWPHSKFTVTSFEPHTDLTVNQFCEVTLRSICNHTVTSRWCHMLTTRDEVSVWSLLCKWRCHKYLTVTSRMWDHCIRRWCAHCYIALVISQGE